MDAATGISYQESQLEKEAYTGLNGNIVQWSQDFYIASCILLDKNFILLIKL